MTQVKAIPVEIILEGSRFGRTIYLESYTSYGVTIGEVMDNMVKKSLKMADNVQLWMIATQSADYLMKQDFWTLKFRMPAMIPGFHEDSETESIYLLSDIVSAAVCVRSTYLQSCYNQMEEIALTFYPQEELPLEMRDDLLETHNELSILDCQTLTLSAMSNIGIIGRHFDAVVSLIPSLPKANRRRLKKVKRAQSEHM